jgi:transposase
VFRRNIVLTVASLVVRFIRSTCPVHCKSVAAQETRALTARTLVQSKLYDIEMSLRGILRGFGLKVGPTTSKRCARRIEELVAGHATLEVIAKALPSLHAALLREFDMFEKRVRAIARQDKRVRLIMSARATTRRRRPPPVS